MISSKEILLLVIMHLIVITAYIYWYSKITKLVSPANQKVNKNEIYLMLIPAVGLYWFYTNIQKINDSLSSELVQRNLPPNSLRGNKLSRNSILFYILVFVPIIQYIGMLLFLNDNLMIHLKHKKIRNVLKQTN